MDRFELAKSQAKINNMPVMLSFSGSDWCGWCMKLDKEVFAQEEFKKWASGNIITVKVDFPRSSSLPREEEMENNSLAEQYSVTGFPTVVIVDSDGKEIGRTGYQRGGASNFINILENIIN